MGATPLGEQGWHPDAIERQLARQEPNDIRAAYNYATMRSICWNGGR